MTTNYTKELLDKYGWTFVPSHDIPTEFGFKAVPESYVHEDGNIVWDIDDVISDISDQIELGIERDLT